MRSGERIVAGVVTSEQGVSERVMEKLKLVLPLYKVPREVHDVKDFPRNEMGKVQKKVLRKLWENSDVGQEENVGRG